LLRFARNDSACRIDYFIQRGSAAQLVLNSQSKRRMGSEIASPRGAQ